MLTRAAVAAISATSARSAPVAAASVSATAAAATSAASSDEHLYDPFDVNDIVDGDDDGDDDMDDDGMFFDDDDVFSPDAASIRSSASDVDRIDAVLLTLRQLYQRTRER
jgi:hypothetical protein